MTAFDQAMARAQREVEAALDRLLPKPEGPEGRLFEAMRYAVFAGGKRFRPFLVCESARLFAVANEAALRVAAAVECVHTHSLVHDDLPCMDDDDLRRGQPTVHRKFDEATAVLAGDALLTFAFELLGEPETHERARVRIELVRRLAAAAYLGANVTGTLAGARDLVEQAHGADPDGAETLQVATAAAAHLLNSDDGCMV